MIRMVQEGETMLNVDYHIHSVYSFDGILPLEEIAQIGVEKNLDELAITDHIELASSDVGVPDSANGAREEFERVKKKFQGKICLRRGIELGNAHQDREKTDRRAF